MSTPTLNILETQMLRAIERVLHEVASADPPSDPNSYLPPTLIEELQRARDHANRVRS